jgi:hypothetical protein
MEDHTIVSLAFGLIGLLMSGVGVYVGLTVRVAVAELKTSMVDLQLRITTETRDREEKVREWALTNFVRH